MGAERNSDIRRTPLLFSACVIVYFVFAQLVLPYVIGWLCPKCNFSQSPAGRVIMLRPLETALLAVVGPFVVYGLLPLVAAALVVHLAPTTTLKALAAAAAAAFFLINPVPLLMLWSWYLSAFVCRNGDILSRKEAQKAYPRFDAIEALWTSGLREECERALDDSANKPCIHDTNPGFNIGKSGSSCWRAVHLKKLGRVVRTNVGEYPILAELIGDKQVYNAFFSILDPGVNIPPHTGYSKSFLRYHLGVRVPRSWTCRRRRAFIRVGGSEHEWQEGVGVVFDYMFRHYVENDCSEERVVLYLDIRRDLSGVTRKIDDAFVGYISAHPIMRSILNVQHRSRKNPGS